MSPFEKNILIKHKEKLESIGFSFIVSAEEPLKDSVVFWAGMPSFPFPLSIEDILELLSQLADDHNEADFVSQITFNDRINKFAASKACRSSIMIGMPLNSKQMAKIIKNLSTLDQPWVNDCLLILIFRIAPMVDRRLDY